MHVITITWKNGPKWDEATHPSFNEFIAGKSADQARLSRSMAFLSGLPLSITTTSSADPSIAWVTTINVLDDANGEAIKNQVVDFYNNDVKASTIAQSYTVEVVASQV